jgi:subtilisin
MPDPSELPAWSEQFSVEALRELVMHGPLAGITREWAWGGSTGKGIRVAIIDSGVEYDHPLLEGKVGGGVAVEYDETAENRFRVVDDPLPLDLCGHGTACGGIIHTLAPEAELWSVRVLGKDLRGRAIQFAGGLNWAIEQGIQIINLSLSTGKEEYYGLFHQLADAAYFRRVMLISAANNIPAPCYPSLYSSVISVAAHAGRDPLIYYYNPAPPVDFGAPGIDVEVAWKDKATMTSTGNSFAAPVIAGLVTLILAKHPELTPFQVKTILAACASNVHPQ